MTRHTSTIDVDKLTKTQIVSIMMEKTTEQTALMLLGIYNRFITDQLDADYLEQLGRQFGIDLEAEFIKHSIQQQTEEDDEL